MSDNDYLDWECKCGYWIFSSDKSPCPFCGAYSRRSCEMEASEISGDKREAAAHSSANCDHDWQIWPETDGQEQRCMKCGKYRKTQVDMDKERV